MVLVLREATMGKAREAAPGWNVFSARGLDRMMPATIGKIYTEDPI